MIEPTIPSRFRGALLGLALSPIPFDASAQGWARSSEAKRVSLWNLSLGMLRHHDRWETRWQWLTSAAKPSCLTLVQSLIIGDLLERVLCNGLTEPPHQHLALDTKGEFSDFTYLETRLSRYDLPTEAQQYYQMAFTYIANDLSPEQSQDVFSQDAFISGVLCGMQQPPSYGLSVQIAAQFGDVAVIVAGLLAGAMGAESALPVLWQLSDRATASDRAENLPVNYLKVVAIANRLFNQWAGVLSA